MDNIDNNTNEVVNPTDKKKRGRKKNFIIASVNSDDHGSLTATATENIKEKKTKEKKD